MSELLIRRPGKEVVLLDRSWVIGRLNRLLLPGWKNYKGQMTNDQTRIGFVWSLRV